LVAGCDGRDGITRRVTPKRTAKPCGPGPPTLGSSSARHFEERRWLSSPAHRGEHGAAVKTIAQGRPGRTG
jgi:hypothetical protein